MADFCRKHNLPQHRFTRWKHAFQLVEKEGYKNKWVRLCPSNEAMVKEIKSQVGTKPRAARLSLEEFSQRHQVDMKHFEKVFHRLQKEIIDGKFYLIDTRFNLTLLKLGRIIRKA